MMCGLAGFVGPPDENTISTMTRRLSHRGPDGSGTWIDRNLGIHLGHRRLAIVDIEGGRQPMWNEDDTVAVVFNGQIYNHLELREQLIRRGHIFRSSHSDTEVLVHGYEEWGTALAERLNGMFAFAVVDRRSKALFLARDRFGEKPLFWALVPHGIAFASELTALALHPRVSSSVDLKILQKYFAHGFIPAPNALLQGAYKVRPGSWLLYSLQSRSVSEGIYWKFQIEPDESLGQNSERRLIDELQQRLSKAVERRLMSDVPLGVYLSGGLDSSAVLAFARSALPMAEIKTFNIGFTDRSYDESDYAQRVADSFRATHYSETLDLQLAKGLIPHVLGNLDEPLGDPSIIPTYLVARFTRKHVTVALSGDGGDEIFAGYDPFDALWLAQAYSRLVPPQMHQAVRRMADLLPRSERNMSFDFKVRRALQGLSFPECLWNPIWLAPMCPKLLHEVFNAPVPTEQLYSEVLEDWNASPGLSLVDRTLQFYTNFYLPDNILVKSDRASMLNSLESRAIFLDNDLVDFARRLPSHFKYRSGQRKYLLKKALEGFIPNFVLERPKKGFGIPLVSWLKDVNVQTSPAPAGMSGKRIERMVAEQRTGRSDNRLAVWSWLALRTYLAAAEEPNTRSLDA